MKTMPILGMALLAVAGTAAFAQQPGFRRTELQRHDLAVPGHEVVQVRVEVDPGATIPRHTHAGDEAGYVIDGTVEFRLDGRAPLRIERGHVFFIPAGVVHTARNVGSGPGVVLATYVIEKGKPLATPAR